MLYSLHGQREQLLQLPLDRGQIIGPATFSQFIANTCAVVLVEEDVITPLLPILYS